MKKNDFRKQVAELVKKGDVSGIETLVFGLPGVELESSLEVGGVYSQPGCSDWAILRGYEEDSHFITGLPWGEKEKWLIPFSNLQGVTLERLETSYSGYKQIGRLKTVLELAKFDEDKQREIEVVKSLKTVSEETRKNWVSLINEREVYPDLTEDDYQPGTVIERRSIYAGFIRDYQNRWHLVGLNGDFLKPFSDFRVGLSLQEVKNWVAKWGWNKAGTFHFVVEEV
jgi:hypothetical protein